MPHHALNDPAVVLNEPILAHRSAVAADNVFEVLVDDEGGGSEHNEFKVQDTDRVVEVRLRENYMHPPSDLFEPNKILLRVALDVVGKIREAKAEPWPRRRCNSVHQAVRKGPRGDGAGRV